MDYAYPQMGKVRFQKSSVSNNIPIGAHLNTHLISRVARKLQDRVDIKYLEVVDPDGHHRHGFSNRNSRHEVFTFLDQALNMFSNRLISRIRNARTEIQTNIDLRNHALTMLRNVEDLQFNDDIVRIIEEEVTAMYRTTELMNEVDGYINPFLFSIALDEPMHFARYMCDLMHEALLDHYRAILCDYRDKLYGLGDYDRTVVCTNYQGTLLDQSSLEDISRNIDLKFDSQYIVPWVDQAIAEMPSPKPISLNVNVSPKKIKSIEESIAAASPRPTSLSRSQSRTQRSQSRSGGDDDINDVASSMQHLAFDDSLDRPLSPRGRVSLTSSRHPAASPSQRPQTPSALRVRTPYGSSPRASTPSQVFSPSRLADAVRPASRRN